jgi:transposase
MTEAQWLAVQQVLPPPKTRGRKPNDIRRVLNGILYLLRVGCSWRKLPRRYGNYVTCWLHYIRLQGDGTWRHIQHVLLTSSEQTGTSEV